MGATAFPARTAFPASRTSKIPPSVSRQPLPRHWASASRASGISSSIGGIDNTGYGENITLDTVNIRDSNLIKYYDLFSHENKEYLKVVNTVRIDPPSVSYMESASLEINYYGETEKTFKSNINSSKIFHSFIDIFNSILIALSPRRETEAWREMLSYKGLEDGWDGVESKGISDQTVSNALEFFALLPSDVREPEASPSSDGTVDWYWRSGEFGAIVTFFNTGKLVYFAKTEEGEIKGSKIFDNFIPEKLVKYLQKLS